MNLNKVFLIGRLTADPTLRTTTGGQQVATFSIATNRIWNDKTGARRENTEYHNIVVWGKQADVVQRFLNKGGMVFIDGRLQTRTWEDKQGQRRKTTEIVADRIQLGPKAFGRQPEAASAAFPPAGGPAAGPAVPEIPTIDLDVGPEDLNF